MASKLLYILLSIILLTQLILPSSVMAQYAGILGGDDLLVTPGCAGLTPNMKLSWVDPGFSTSYYEIWKTDGSIPQTPDGLQGFYYPNKELKGQPTLNRVDTNVDFNFDTSPPPNYITNNGDEFSVRWTGFLLVPAGQGGNYTFTIRINDGGRLWVNGTKVIDDWHNNDTYKDRTSSQISLQGGVRYPITYDYFENTGPAEARLKWNGPATSGSTVVIPSSQFFSSSFVFTKFNPVTTTPKSVPDGLEGSYYSNKDLKGAPALQRLDTTVDFNFANTPPPASVAAPGADFSVVWTGQVLIPTTGNYNFHIDISDGGKLFVDGLLVIDKWDRRDTTQQFTSNKTFNFAAGTKHNIAFEYYYESAGASEARLKWSGAPSATPVAIPAAQLFSASHNQNYNSLLQATADGLHAQYFPNKTLSGFPVLDKVDSQVNFDFDSNPPQSSVTPDGNNFSVRWTGELLVPAGQGGDYTFYIEINDGGRLFLDGEKIIDKWGKRSLKIESPSAPIKLAAGSRHKITFEYFEETGESIAKLKWSGPDSSNTKVVIPQNRLFSGQFNYTDSTSLIDNTPYRYKIVAYRVVGNIHYGLSTVKWTNDCKPVTIVPDPPLASCVSNNPQIQVGWTSSSGSTSYNVWRAEISDTLGFNPNSSNNLGNSLVSYWNFDDLSTSTVLQDGKGVNYGLLNGTTVPSGIKNNSRSFDGINDYVSFVNDQSLNFNKNFTLTAWVKPSSLSKKKSIISKATPNGEIQYELMLDGNQAKFFYSSSNNSFSVSGGNLDTDWSFIAVTMDSSRNVKLFVDDMTIPVDNKQANFDSTISNNPLTIGRRSVTTPFQYFAGSLDEFGIWNRVLTQAELEDLFNGGQANTYVPAYLAWNRVAQFLATSPFNDSPSATPPLLQNKSYAYYIGGNNAGGSETTQSLPSYTVRSKTCSLPTILSKSTLLTCYTPGTWGASQLVWARATDSSSAIASVKFTLNNITAQTSLPPYTGTYNAGQTRWEYSVPPPSVIGNNYSITVVATDSDVPPNSSPVEEGLIGNFTYQNSCAQPWIKTTGGDVHTNTKIDTPGGP